jgi:hypothetical protein
MAGTSKSISLMCLVIGVGALAAACAPMDGSNATIDPARPDCQPSPPVQITRIEPLVGDSSKRQLTVDHEPAHVCQSRGGTVRWRITDPAARMYSFIFDGIVFKDWPPPGTTSVPGRQQYDWIFPAQSPSSSTPKATTLTYTINFRESGNGGRDSNAKKWTCDPTVVSSDVRYRSEPGSATFTCNPLP